MKKTAICYKQTIPTIYNQGTKWETSCCEFLAYYSHKTVEEAQKECDEINTMKPVKLFNGQLAECDNRTYFAIEQDLI